MNALLDETKAARIELGLPWLRELKVSPTIKGLLLEEKPVNLGWGDFAIFAMLAFVLIGRIVRFDLIGVIRLVARVVGELPAERPGPPETLAPHPTFAGSPDVRRKPASKARSMTSRRPAMQTVTVLLLTLSLLTGCASMPSGRPNVPAEDLSRLGAKDCFARGGKLVVSAAGDQRCVGAK